MNNIASEAYVLMDADSGAMLAGKNENQPLPPASMSKMMTELLVLDMLRSGDLSYEEKVPVSSYAASVPGAGMGIEEGQSYTVRSLLTAVVVLSANDAAVALAEHAGGSEKKFVDRMNGKAKEIELSDGTRFANATGLSPEDLQQNAPYPYVSEMPAKDTAKLAAYLISNYPEILEISKLGDVRLPGKMNFAESTNLMLPGKVFAYDGTDGLKTGYTEAAGYCFTGTAERDGHRLIAVVMGAPNKAERFKATKILLDYGFLKV
ncbi:D-alanyl-D-alanine carboxypeptidase family protein [Paenibacillus thermotolerans]|uniref:D-alanyl-D-alanine carboxypeptidase family protein n=1 Tax=Paenibacillus thermotolerans TaxID=3027807 RepID=UPI0023681669|nr:MULTISPECIES: D-alanyl-D-alanine carboxypeptidase family protein [unclassified Paenibacillus]